MNGFSPGRAMRAAVAVLRRPVTKHGARPAARLALLLTLLAAAADLEAQRGGTVGMAAMVAPAAASVTVALVSRRDGTAAPRLFDMVVRFATTGVQAPLTAEITSASLDQ